MKTKKAGKPGRYSYEQVSVIDDRILCPGCNAKLPALRANQYVQCPGCKYHILRRRDGALAYDANPPIFQGDSLPVVIKKSRLKAVKAGKAGADSY